MSSNKICYLHTNPIKSHIHSGEKFKCDQCHKYGDKMCLAKDFWPERIMTNTFICYDCLYWNK